MGAAALLSLGTTVSADENGKTGHVVDVIPGEWGDDGQKLNFTFQDMPIAEYSGLHLNLTCGLPGAKIYYTTDSKAKPENEEAWTEYTEPLYLTENCTIRFFARNEGYKDSDVQEYQFIFLDHQVLTPVIAPDVDRTSLVMVTDTQNAVIRYTTDGSEPTAESPVYEGPVLIEANGTFRARAFADEMFDSEISDYVVDFLTVVNPSALFANKAVELVCDDENAKIWYTTDAEASADNTEAWKEYSAPLALTEDCNVRFFGRRNGYNDSEVQSFSFLYSAYQVAVPLISANESGNAVEMSCETEGAEIRYTTDGSEPTLKSSLYTAPVEIVSNGTFRARAFVDGMFESNIAEFIIMHLAVPVPTASFDNKKLTLTCDDAKATVWYTTDPTATPDNTDAWKQYKEPVALTENCVVRFYGRRDNFNDSDIQSFSFVYSNYRVADPAIERNNEGTHIVMESATPGAEIRYTTDGSEPTAKSKLYNGPIEIEGNFTYSAIAIADGLFDSQVNRYIVSNMAVAVPSASFENKKMVLSCPDSKAQILYTLDPEATVDDASAWTVYNAPIELTDDCTLRFFTRRANFNDSDIESLSFVYAAYQAQAPVISRNAQGTHVVMTSAVENGVIRYTTDGSEPTAQSTAYEKPIRIDNGATYRARVFADNMFDSEMAEYLIGNEKLTVPEAAFENFNLVLTTSDKDAQIWYTNDPELSVDNIDDWTLYETPIALVEDGIIRFFAGDDEANASDVQTFVFQMADYQVAAPTVERNEEGTHIVMETPTEGAEIRYTTDGSEPTKESELYNGPVEILCNGTFRAKAFVDGLYDSIVTDFIVNNIAAPVAYASFENKMLTLTCSDPEAEIWFTNDDDATPESDEEWTLYTTPINLEENCFIHFFTRRDNFNDSDIETFVFLRANYMAAAPVIERSEDGRSVVMNCETEGAEIRYTTDGSEPTQESELYTGPVFLTSNCTFRAKAFVEGLFESSLSEFSVANLMMMMPTATYDGSMLVLSVWDSQASIWYTTDPDALPEETDAWTLYTEPLSFSEPCTVRFFARRMGFLDSQISDFMVDATSGVNVAEASAQGFSIARDGADIVVTSDKELRLPVYTIGGSLVRIADIQAGRNVISGLAKGAYIIGGKKFIF